MHPTKSNSKRASGMRFSQITAFGSDYMSKPSSFPPPAWRYHWRSNWSCCCCCCWLVQLIQWGWKGRKNAGELKHASDDPPRWEKDSNFHLWNRAREWSKSPRLESSLGNGSDNEGGILKVSSSSFLDASEELSEIKFVARFFSIKFRFDIFPKFLKLSFYVYPIATQVILMQKHFSEKNITHYLVHARIPK